MTWEETIRFIRAKQEYSDLIEQAYLHENLEKNVHNFSSSEEFGETIKIIEEKKSGKLRILDVGCGNGIASVSFALKGHEVVAIDPDQSLTIGTGAVDILKEKLDLKNITVINSTAEDFNYDFNSFDLVYARQAMHHAYDLNKFVENSVKYLKRGGLFFTVRDHVIIDGRDKENFLRDHPLHKFYLGENAFKSREYRSAFHRAGLEILMELKFFDSIINYFPMSLTKIESRIKEEEFLIKKNLRNRLGVFGQTELAYTLYTNLFFDPISLASEQSYPGRMYTYLSEKK